MALRLKWTTSVIVLQAFINMTDGMWRFNKEIHPKTGQFKRLEWQTESQQVRCNDAYYMLSYLNLSNPQYYRYPTQIDALHRSIDGKYSEWPRKMLVTAFNVAQNDAEMNVAWLLYLYYKRIEVHVHATKDPLREFLPVLRTSHYGMYKMVLCTMFENDCTMLSSTGKKERKFTAYLGDIKRSKPADNDFLENQDALLKLLKKHWPDLVHNSSPGCCQQDVAGTSAEGPSVQPLTENNFTKDLLYLNDVFENAQAITLLTDFGVFEGGDALVRYLKVKINETTRGSWSFGEYVLSLVDFHEHVQRALKTMLLRIYYVFLDKLNAVPKDEREEHVKIFLRPYDDWFDFLYLPKKHNGFYVHYLYQTWVCSGPSAEVALISVQRWVTEELQKTDEMSNVPLDNHTAESLQSINIDVPWISMTLLEYKVTIDPRFEASRQRLKEDIRPIIFCAEALIAYIKKILAGVDFRAIQSLVKLATSTDFKRFKDYEQQYDPNVLVQEDQTNTIQVCGIQRIEYSIE